MKTLIAAVALIPLLVPDANAGCAVRCRNQVVETFVATPYAYAVGVPVAQYAATTYTYQPQQAPQVSVHVHLDAATLRAAIAESAEQPANSPRLAPAQPPEAPQPPQQESSVLPRPGPLTTPQPPPPVASAVSANCLSCHSPGHNAAALAKIDLTLPLTCEQRLACARAILAGKMPKGKQLDADAAGHVLEEIVGVK